MAVSGGGLRLARGRLPNMGRFRLQSARYARPRVPCLADELPPHPDLNHLSSVFVGGVLVKVFGITARNFHMAVLAGIIGALCRFPVGCWIARRAPDRALSAWLVVLISPGGGSRQIRRSPSFSAVGAVSGLAGKQLGSCIVLICKQV